MNKYDLVDELKEDKLIKKYLYKYTWLSGSSTTVYPIMCWEQDGFIKEITIQLDADKNVFNKLIERYKNKYNNIDYAYFDKSDGSCPSKLVFKIKESR